MILLPQPHPETRKQWHEAAARLRAICSACHPSSWRWRGSLTPAELLDLAARLAGRLSRHATADGARPWLHITLRRAAAVLEGAPPDPGLRQRLTILLVEPRRTMRHTLTRLLQHARIAVLPVTDGRGAKEALQTAATAGVRFHLVMADARLRDTTSMALVHEIRLLAPGIPILLLCAPRTPLPAGVVSHTTPVLPLVTPVSWSQLASGLERAVRAVRPGDSILTPAAPADSAGDASAPMPARSTHPALAP